MSSFKDPVVRRRYQREYARKRRARELAARTAGQTRCQRRLGRGGPCGGRLEDVRDPMTGRVAVVCPNCERTARGLCLDCPRPVDGTIGKARRCRDCRRKANNAATYRSYQRNAEKRRAAGRARYEQNAAERERRNLLKQARRKLRRDVTAREKRAATRQPTTRMVAYQARYREKHRAYLAARQRERYLAKHGPPKTPTCRDCHAVIPWTPGTGRPCLTCDQCCAPSERRRRETVRARRAAEGATVAPPPVAKAKLVRTPKAPAPRVDGYRLCVGAGCDRVVTGRKKKCSHCKAREAQEAAQLIASLGVAGRPAKGAAA